MIFRNFMQPSALFLLLCIGLTSCNVQNLPETTPSPSASFLQDSVEQQEEAVLFPVARIVDGDTIWVRINGEDEKIRLLGIDTPETEKDFTPVECYADQAEDYLTELLASKQVALLTSKIGDQVDQYDRLLRYVFADGKDVGAELVAQGYAFAFRRYPHDRMVYYVQLETEAKQNKKGMWNPENCSYW